MRHCVKEVDSLFHPKVRGGEDSIKELPGVLDKKPERTSVLQMLKEVRCPGVQSYRLPESEG